MDETPKISKELERSRAELNILYEVSNAMRTTLRLDEILYIILTGVTAHTGLGFNRATLFLVNEHEGVIEGKMAIGPESGEEAQRIWKQIENEKLNMDDLINAFKVHAHVIESPLNKEIRHFRIPIQDESGGLLTLCAQEGMPLHLTRDTIKQYANDQVVRVLRSEELVVVPLKAKDKVNGIIIADNFITKKPINKEDVRMLIMLGNQAGLAIENSRLYEQTVLRAHSDSLTELWNHGYFQYLLQVCVERAKLTNGHASLIMIDIDDFKVYNDTLGHQVGDRMLKELAAVLKNQSRRMDYVARYGGEEFAIILPHTDKKEALLIAERFLREIQKQHFMQEEILPHKKLTVSMGIATFPEDGSTPAEIIEHSDKSLYKAKFQGKNQICS